MKTKRINGKAIYSPKGKAGEYAAYACNFYVGCSNDCQYCYCKRGVLGHAMGAPVATLKKCFKDEADAFEVFRKEVKANLEALREHGLFFTFSSDPMLENTRKLTINAVGHAVSFGIPCKILTKRADFIDYLPGEWIINEWYRTRIAFGFTLTGMDELEPGANTNEERVKAMRTINGLGFHTFASIEPVINPHQSIKMIIEALYSCDLYQIGLLSGHKDYTKEHIRKFIDEVHQILSPCSDDPKVYWKESVLNFLGITREELISQAKTIGNDYVIVDKNYNIFRDQ